jgi:RNA polymerase sigma factor (TIGR02999 family)
MSADGPRDRVAELLDRVRQGDGAAAGELLPLVYRELHATARRILSQEPRSPTLQTTSLLHEAWLRLDPGSAACWEDETHFIRIAARAMRQVLVDHARARGAHKRGGGRRPLTLDEEVLQVARDEEVDLCGLDGALEKLADRDEELVRLVELRFFAGLTNAEAARILGLTPRQAHRAWTFARGWLRRELDSADG